MGSPSRPCPRSAGGANWRVRARFRRTVLESFVSMLALESPDPRDAPLVRFFARAHSVDAAIEGWRLALWCPKEPAALERMRGHEGTEVVFGWPGSGGRAPTIRVATVPVHVLVRAPELLESGQRVVLAKRQLPDEVFDLLRDRLGYEPDVPGQITGWWYDVDDHLPETPPAWRETAALLPAEGTLRDGVESLVLVDVNDCAYVLSERALRTYTFGARIAEDEPLLFVRFTVAGREVWRVTPAEPLDANTVAVRFARHRDSLFAADGTLASRVRRDARSVVVRVVRDAR